MNSLTRNPIIVLITSVIVMIYVGYGIIAGILMTFIDQNYWEIADSTGVMRKVTSVTDFGTVVYRLTIAISGMALVSSVLFLCTWFLMCINNKKIILEFTSKQRLRALLSFILVPFIFLIVSVLQLPSTILFDGPLRNFHPFQPIVLLSSSILGPVVFWKLVSTFENRPDNVKGNDGKL